MQPDVAEVPADPQRIVVLSGDQLDALCALGLQSRIVGAALPDGSSGQPSYLGTVVHELPGVGTRSNPDLEAIKAAKPDLILGSQALTPKLYPRLGGDRPDGVHRGTRRRLAEQPARSRRGDRTRRRRRRPDQRLHPKAHDDGAAHDAAHFQASIVQLTENTVRVYGADNFPASVLTAVGVDRPAAQRFTDKAYVEVGSTDADLSRQAPNFSAADADVIYVSFAFAGRQGPRADRLRQRPVAPSYRPTATTGSSSSTTRSGRPARAWSPPAASSTTCAGSTRRSTSPRCEVDLTQRNT